MTDAEFMQEYVNSQRDTPGVPDSILDALEALAKHYHRTHPCDICEALRAFREKMEEK